MIPIKRASRTAGPGSTRRSRRSPARRLRLGGGLPQLSPPGGAAADGHPHRVPRDPGPPRSLRWGVGVAAGTQVEAHLAGGFEHRNLFGELGRLTLDAKLGLVLYPLVAVDDRDAGPVRPLPEARLRADLVQPISLRSQTNALAGGALNMYELLPGDLLGYFEVAGKAGVERSFWGSRVRLGLLGKFQFDQPFLYPSVSLLPASSGYGPVTVPLVELNATLDLRTGEERQARPGEPPQRRLPHRDTQVAGLDTSDVRGRAELRGYVPIAPRWTLAMRLGGGLLHAFGGPLAGGGVPVGACSAAAVAAKGRRQLRALPPAPPAPRLPERRPRLEPRLRLRRRGPARAGAAPPQSARPGARSRAAS